MGDDSDLSYSLFENEKEEGTKPLTPIRSNSPNTPERSNEEEEPKKSSPKDESEQKNHSPKSPNREESTAIYLADLPWWTTDVQLEEMMGKFGKVKEMKFFDNKTSGKLGYVLVDFGEHDIANTAKEKLDGSNINGTPCSVQFVAPRNSRYAPNRPSQGRQERGNSSSSTPYNRRGGSYRGRGYKGTHSGDRGRDTSTHSSYGKDSRDSGRESTRFDDTFGRGSDRREERDSYSKRGDSRSRYHSSGSSSSEKYGRDRDHGSTDYRERESSRSSDRRGHSSSSSSSSSSHREPTYSRSDRRDSGYRKRSSSRRY